MKYFCIKLLISIALVIPMLLFVVCLPIMPILVWLGIVKVTYRDQIQGHKNENKNV